MEDAASMPCHLRVGLLPAPGCCNAKIVNKTVVVKGLTQNFMQDLAPYVNCSFSYKIPRDLTYGSKSPDGKWIGILGQLLRNETDITIPIVARTLDRDATGEATAGIFDASVVFLAGHKASKESNIVGYLLTFDLDVWMYLIFSMVLLSLMASLLHTASYRMRGRSSKFTELWSKYVQMFFENMFCEASPETPNEMPVRVLSAVWWITVMVLMNAFAGQMRACMMVHSDVARISGVADVNARVQKGELLPYTMTKTEIERSLKESSRQDFRTLYEAMQSKGTLLKGFVYFSPDLLMEVVEGKAVILHVDRLLQEQVTAFCKGKYIGEFYFAEEKINTWQFASYMRRSLPKALKERIKKFVVLYNESGLREYQWRFLSPPLEQCTAAESDGELRFGDIVSIFYLWMICCLGAAAVFVVELLQGFRRRR